jgi:hypothetical protein
MLAQIFLIVLAPESMRGCIVIFYILQFCSATFLFILVALHVSVLCPLYMLPLLYFLLGAKCKSPYIYLDLYLAKAHERLLINKVRQLGKTLIPSLPTSSTASCSSSTSHLGFFLPPSATSQWRMLVVPI